MALLKFSGPPDEPFSMCNCPVSLGSPADSDHWVVLIDTDDFKVWYSEGSTGVRTHSQLQRGFSLITIDELMSIEPLLP